jgi:alpha-D-ribose 1-methylphosphonate 5-triphosphate synthase subunit PhnH
MPIDMIVVNEHVGGPVAHQDRGTAFAVVDAVAADDDMVGFPGRVTLDPHAGAVVALLVDIEALDHPVADAGPGGIAAVGLEVEECLVVRRPDDRGGVWSRLDRNRLLGGAAVGGH